MEKKMETTIVYWGYIGIMEKKMETTIYDGIMLGSYWEKKKSFSAMWKSAAKFCCLQLF